MISVFLFDWVSPQLDVARCFSGVGIRGFDCRFTYLYIYACIRRSAGRKCIDCWSGKYRFNDKKVSLSNLCQR